MDTWGPQNPAMGYDTNGHNWKQLGSGELRFGVSANFTMPVICFRNFVTFYMDLLGKSS